MKTITTLIIILIIASCSKAQSDSTHAEIIPAPAAGYICFAIKNSDGISVGGNCIKE